MLLDRLLYVCYVAASGSKGEYAEKGSNEDRVGFAFSILIAIPAATFLSIFILPLVKRLFSPQVFDAYLAGILLSVGFIIAFIVFKPLRAFYTNERILAIASRKKRKFSRGWARFWFSVMMVMWWVVIMICALMLIYTASEW